MIAQAIRAVLLATAALTSLAGLRSSTVQRVFAHDADGIGAMVDWLVAKAEQPDQVAVAIETPHGPIVEALMDRGVAVFAINPKQLDRFRDRFSPAGAKDDRRDALVLGKHAVKAAAV